MMFQSFSELLTKYTGGGLTMNNGLYMLQHFAPLLKWDMNLILLPGPIAP